MSMSRGAHDSRVSVDGRFFSVGGRRLFIKGVTYGPLTAGTERYGYADRLATARDFSLVRQLGANVLRIYTPPPGWFLDLAEESGLKLLIDAPWERHVCFLESIRAQREARIAVRELAQECRGHPAVLGLCVVNEIAADVVRWGGVRAVEEFVDALLDEVKQVDPDRLCTFGNFPPTEYLSPQNLDFHCFNVYLHQQAALQRYLARLQLHADSKPLIIGETGVDTMREGEEAQARMLDWQLETMFRSGLAGAIIFSFTDEWFKAGDWVKDWAFGLTRRDRSPKPAFFNVQSRFAAVPSRTLPRTPLVSVVVAAYNAEKTLPACLESLGRLGYPEVEVILVDDGSTDGTALVAQQHPGVRYIRHSKNEGLSVARNTGISAARGEIVAFTDADCRVDSDWLFYLVGELLSSGLAGMGGPNLLPPDDSCVAAAVMASPGGPAHVMLNDQVAEHIPGCNMAFHKHVLEEIGGFDPTFRKAGDDVDVCWRIQQRGHQIGFCPAAFVWHHRRSTVGAYLQQQRGYGEAEALLVRKHPEYFNFLGSSVWRGRIYASAARPRRSRATMIYRGPFASGFFQTVYHAPDGSGLEWLTSLEFHAFVTLPLLVLGSVMRVFASIGLACLLLSLGACIVAASRVEVPRRKLRPWSRPLVALLFFLQPLVRGWARYRGRWQQPAMLLSQHEDLDSLSLVSAAHDLSRLSYWAQSGIDRIQFLRAVMDRLTEAGWPHRADAGWGEADLEILGNRWTKLCLTTVAEQHPGGPVLLRCRIAPTCTLLAHGVIGSACAIDLLLFGWFGLSAWWGWCALALTGLLGWRIHEQGSAFQRIVRTLLMRVAKHFDLKPCDENV